MTAPTAESDKSENHGDGHTKDNMSDIQIDGNGIVRLLDRVDKTLERIENQQSRSVDAGSDQQIACVKRHSEVNSRLAFLEREAKESREKQTAIMEHMRGMWQVVRSLQSAQQLEDAIDLSAKVETLERWVGAQEKIQAGRDGEIKAKDAYQKKMVAIATAVGGVGGLSGLGALAQAVFGG